MSWIGGSISSLTGQLSNLTKDILTEGTEEVGDPATELRLAKEKIQQLDSLLTSQRQENERLKRINKELEEKAESAELQINTISREYRGLLESKEKEVNTLKHQYQELLEQHARTAALSVSPQEGATPAASSSTSTAHHSRDQGHSHSWASPALRGEEFASFNYDGDSGDWDFDDSIRLQRENNSLRAELQRLQSEVKHWRSVAGQLGQNAGQDSEQLAANCDVLDLQRKVESLEAQLAKKQDELQQQAASLHEHHRQKVANMKSRQKAEIDVLHQQLATLEQHLVDARDGGNSSQHSGSGNLPESDRLNVSERETELQNRLTEAVRETEKAQNARKHLEGVLEELQQEVEVLQQQQQQQQPEQGGHEDRSSLLQRITDLTERLQGSETLRLELERELQEVREELRQTKHRLLDQLDANHADAQEVLSDLRELKQNLNTDAAYRRDEMRAERRTLVNQLFRVGQQKNQLTQALQSAKLEQEEALTKAENVVEKIGDTEQQKTVKDLIDTLEKENLLLKEEKLKLEEQITLLEKTASTSATERQTLQQRVTNLKSQLRTYTGEDDIDTDDTLDEDISTDSSASGSRGKNAALYVEKAEVEKELSLLRAQLSRQNEDLSNVEMERSDWLMEREALDDVITDLRKQTQTQREEITSLKAGKTSTVSLSSEPSVEGDVEALQEEVSSLREEKSELENALEELDSQHSQALEQLIHKRDQMSEQLAQCNHQIQQQQEQIQQLNNLVTQLKQQESSPGQQEAGKDDTDGAQRQMLEEKCKQLEAELAQARTLPKASNNTLEKEVADLREKLQKGGLVINDLHMDKQELESELKTAKEEMASKVGKIKEMRKENLELQEEKKNLEKRLLEMEDRLSEMEEEVEKWQQVNEEKQVQQMNVEREHEECERLKSQVAAMEREKQLFQSNFEHLSSSQPDTTLPFEDAIFKKVLEEESKVRSQMEEDHQLIEDLKQQVKIQYDKKQNLKVELQELQRSHEADKAKMGEFEKRLEQSDYALQLAHQEKLEVEQRLTKDYEKSQALESKLSQANDKLAEAGKQNEELSEALSHYERVKSDLEIQLQSQKTHYDAYIQELKAGQELGAESLQAEHQKLLDLQREMGLEIDRLQAQVQEKVELEAALELKKQEVEELNRMVVSFKKELNTVRAEATHLEGLKNASQQGSVTLQNEIERLKSQLAEDQSLREMISQLESELTTSNDTIARLHQDLSAAQETIKCQEAGIADLNEKADEQRRNLQQVESDATRQKSTIAVLRQTSVDKETVLSEIEGKLNFLLTILTPQQIERLQNFSQNAAHLPALEYNKVPAIEFSGGEQTSDSLVVEIQESQQSESPPGPSDKTDSEVNGYIIEEDFDSGTSDRERFTALEKEVDDLRDGLKEKDVIVADLQKSNSSLLTLLEKGGGGMDRSVTNQLASHKLEAEIRSLKAEREQMVAVVTEKSRENSVLKNEVRRLMEIVSAGQAALEKLQEDNRRIEERQHSPQRDDEDEDMKREALANMARLVRDRETEIEALKQKNETLLAVLQESGESQAAAHLAPLLKDKDILSQQVAALTSEREQLIACVTQKHSESLAYHAEVQRLSAVVVEAEEAKEKAVREYQALIPAFEDKTQALLAAQNELIKCKQKLSDLEVRHGELIQRSSSQDSISSPAISNMEEELERLKNTEFDLKTTLSQRDEKIHSLTHHINTLEENITARDNECAHLRKQAENSKFQLTGLMAEMADMKAEREQMQQKTTAQDTESASLREVYNRMSLETKEKEAELSSLKEQVNTLSSLLKEQQGEHGQVAKLMKDNEMTMTSVRQLQHERDQQAMLAEQRLQECNALRSELSHLKDKEFKMTRELERLRGHLIEIEEGYTREALESEEREKELRNRLANAEEHLLSSSSQVELASKESSRQIESLQQQLQHVASQRDSAYMQVANTQEQCQQYASSLSNLQLVLEHFQKEKDSAIAGETEHLQNECKVLKIEVKELQAELEATRGDLTEALDGLEAATRLSEQLDRKEEELAALKEEVQLREKALSEAEEEISKLTSSTEAKVDKMLMHNMVMTWLTSPEGKRMEIVHLIGNILGFTQEDFQKIEAAQGSGGLLSGIFRRPSNSPQTTPVRKMKADQSFSQLFVKFLEKESSPPPSPVRLPAEAMAAETQHRHKPAFNPFTAPRHVTHEGHRSSTPSSHILMTPDSPTSTPLFTPVTSTASSESAILKDVLGKR